ncbi:MAG: hypothetical protein CMO34_04075 [Verrucomicrobia bacterium]|nr:hypothetical protein [Verrucomicrobiota bacterium]
MRKLELHFDTELQGKFELKELNLLLVFQVHCPGCFSYALPLFNKLFMNFESENISFLALSTAFEDFEKNTMQNTKSLVESGTLIGETKKFLNQQGYKKLPYQLDFPIAMDKIGLNNPEELRNAIERICSINPNYKIWPEFEKTALQDKVKSYLNSLDQIALTFTINQLRGTPSLVLFNSNYEILSEWFGHVSYQEIASKVKQFNRSS